MLLPPALVPLLPLPVPAPARSVPSHPGTLCNHKANAEKVSERDKERVGPVPSLTVAKPSMLPLYGRCYSVGKDRRTEVIKSMG